MRECKEYEITIEKLMRVVHNYTDPIRIRVVIGGAWQTCDEAKHMRDFFLTKCYSYRDTEEQGRLLKYYKDVPVWNLTVWTDGFYSSEKGRTMYMGIEAHCHYEDIREGWLAEKDAERKAKRAEYRKRRKLKAEEGE